MIDRIRHDIQERLDQLLGEAEKLRRALVALGSRDGASPDPRADGRPTEVNVRRAGSAPGAGASVSRQALAQPPTPTAQPGSGSGSGGGSDARARTARGATRGAVLAALAGGGALTAGDVAAATGLGRATVSTTLSKLARTGEVTKAQRGYQLREAGAAGSDGAGAGPSAGRSPAP